MTNCRLSAVSFVPIEMKADFATALQQYLFAIDGWKLEGRQPIKAGSKTK